MSFFKSRRGGGWQSQCLYGLVGIGSGGASVKLRGYQQEVLELLEGSDQSMLIQAPTGAGKTIMFSKFLEAMQAKGKKCLVLAHRGELIRQAEEKLRQATGLKCSVFSAYMGRKQIGDITVASIQSLARCKNKLDFDVIIVDEAHRVPNFGKDSQYKKVLSSISSRLIGFTATPYRLDSGPIYGEGQWWDDLDYQIPLRQLIDEGHLCDYLHRVSEGTKQVTKSMKSVKTSMGEYNQEQAGEVMITSINISSVINTVQDEKSIVVFCVNVAHAEAIAERLESGFSIVHSKMSSIERDKNLKDFDEGRTRWMLNVNVLTEGWDCTRVDCIVLARPTKSTALYVQMVGRGLRLHEGKKRCTIYDIVGCHESFGFVDNPTIFEDDQDRGGDSATKVCSECFAVIDSSCKTCPECGFEEEKIIVETEFVDDADLEHDMRDLDINEHPDYGDVTGGFACWHKSKSGNDCLRVEYRHTKRKTPVWHFYPKDQHWIGTKLANIAKRYNDRFDENYLTASRFMKAVNGGHIFPMKGLRVIEDKSGYEKISTL